MKVGDLVRGSPARRDRTFGVIVRAANDALGFHLECTRFWEIMWIDGLQVVMNDDLEVIND